MLHQKVLIRSYASGVHFGTLTSLEHTLSGTVVTLENSRRIHYWEGACSCTQIALDGIRSGRVALALPSIMIINAVEIIPLSDAAIQNLENQPVWQA